ncbi:MAG: sodium-dependent transporter, partial [Oscillibacter sp.]|nr:sodium-dependent transporter [Oscillibacter sp.]
MSTKRDSWGSKWGFILACIGSAVGMGNIWLFPARVSAYGGATFLIPYFLFVVIIGSTGVIGEMSFGRATRSGPIHAFGAATKQRWGTEKPGKLLGLIPVLGSLALAIGY